MQRHFAAFQETVPLARASKLRYGDVYFCKTLPSHQSEHDWGMSLVQHFHGRPSVDAWLAMRSKLEQAVRGDDALARLVCLVPYHEIGADYIVRCKPPYDGGYSAAALLEWQEYGEGTPLPGCQASYAALVARVKALRLRLDAIDPECAQVLGESLSGENSDLFFNGEQWVLYELAGFPARPAAA